MDTVSQQNRVAKAVREAAGILCGEESEEGVWRESFGEFRRTQWLEEAVTFPATELV